MARPPKLPPELAAEVRAAYATGNATAAELAKLAGCSLRTVQRTLAAQPSPYSDKSPPAPAPAAPPSYIGYADEVAAVASGVTLSAERLGRDPLDVAREAHARVDAVAQRELEAGNVDGFTDLIRQQGLLLGSIRKLEEVRKVDGGAGVLFTHAELEAGAAMVRERVAAYAEHLRLCGGWTCTACGERLRFEFASAPAVTP